MKQELRTIWARLGISIHATQAELDTLMCGNNQNKATVLAKIFSEGRVEIDGDSYIPDNVIAEYNLTHGTNYSHTEVDLETGQLDGKAIRTGSSLLMRQKNRGDAR